MRLGVRVCFRQAGKGRLIKPIKEERHKREKGVRFAGVVRALGAGLATGRGKAWERMRWKGCSTGLCEHQ